MTRVSEETLNEIRQLGMARALRKAASDDSSPEFKEAVHRFYPKANFGPKTASMAASADETDKAVAAQLTPKDAPGPPVVAPAKAAIIRRTAKVKPVNPKDRKPESQVAGIEIAKEFNSSLKEGIPLLKKKVSKSGWSRLGDAVGGKLFDVFDTKYRNKDLAAKTKQLAAERALKKKKEDKKYV